MKTRLSSVSRENHKGRLPINRGRPSQKKFAVSLDDALTRGSCERQVLAAQSQTLNQRAVTPDVDV